jgi:hypothetical protein
MKSMTIKIPTHLTDAELTAELKRLVACERGKTVAVVAHLAAFDARRLYRGAGFPSLYAYCRQILLMSESEAYHRIKAARAARKFPVILEKLAEASLTLTTVRLLAPRLTRQNHQDLIAQALGRSKREVEELLARLFPQPDVPTRIWKPPSPVATVATSTVVDNAAVPSVSDGGQRQMETATLSLDPGAPPVPTLPLPRAFIRPLSPGHYGMELTLSGEALEKLQCAADMLGHAVPSGNEGEIINRALTALLKDLARQKFGDTDRPRASRRKSKDPAYIPAAVQREVWVRGCGRCEFVADDGRRCEARRFIEFHHLNPPSAGGTSTAANLELRCQSHNAYEAERFYGFRPPDLVDDLVREPAPEWRFEESPTGPGASSRAKRPIAAVSGPPALTIIRQSAPGPRSGPRV